MGTPGCMAPEMALSDRYGNAFGLPIGSSVRPVNQRFVALQLPPGEAVPCIAFPLT